MTDVTFTNMLIDGAKVDESFVDRSDVVANTVLGFGYVGTRGDNEPLVSNFLYQSIRLYNRVLSDQEIAHNAALDQIRYIAPPVVTVGGQACTDVVVLSPNFLMCTVPSSSTTGVRDIVVKSSDGLTTYTTVLNGYTYVGDNAFYISSISSIIGGAGKVITFTGNKLDEITKVEAGGKEWTIQSKDLTNCVCKLPDDLGGLTGEVDITITLGGVDYRFARMFEYQ